jgi:two-component system sensor histidine kinase KdpD
MARLSPAARDRVARTLTLAEELGARVRTLPGSSLIEPIVSYARKHNVTKIVVGKPLRSRWSDLWRGSVLDRLVAASGDIDVYVISGKETTPAREISAKSSARAWPPYLASIALIASVTLLSWPISAIIHPTNLVMLYLLAVVIVATRWGLGPSVLAALVGVLFFDVFFVEPKFRFSVSDTQYLVTFVGLFAVGVTVSYLQARARAQAAAAQRREAQTASLYEFSRVLSQSGTLDEIIQATIVHLGEYFGRRVAVLLPQDGHLVEWAKSADMLALDENELAIATWVWEQGQPAGRGTGTLSATTIRYLPLKTPRAVVGVLGIQPSAEAQHLAPEERRLMETFATQAALAIERAILAEQTRQAEEARTAERLQAALLGSISHDLRTPLVTITGVLSTLQDHEARLDDTARASLLDTAEEEAERLNRLVGNLLDMTRLEAGTLRLRLEPCDVADLIGSALEQMSSRLHDRQIITHVPQNLPLVMMDFVLMQQVLVNLLDNALKYSPVSEPVEITACVVGEELEIDVADRGFGIPPDQLARVFDKLYRIQRPQTIGGSGLGLTICKGIVEAHGGRIWAQNRTGGGTVFVVALAIEELGKEAP